MSSKYTIDAIDLSTVKEKTPIPSTLANPVAGVYIISAPGPASLHFGQGGQPWAVVQGKFYRCCPAETDGIYISNTAASGFLIVAVVYVGGAIEVYGQDETAKSAVRVVYSRGLQGGSVNSGPIIQLFNPLTSAQNLIIVRAVAGSGVAGRADISFQRAQLSNNGGGVLTPGAARFTDRRLAPANPIAILRDAGIAGVIAGSTFDNLFNNELGAAGSGVTPTTEELHTVVFSGTNQNGEFLTGGDTWTLPPGWGVAMQHSQNGAGTQLSGFFVAYPQ